MTKNEFSRLQKFIKEGLAESIQSYNGHIFVHKDHTDKVKNWEQTTIRLTQNKGYTFFENIVKGDLVCGIHFKYVQTVDLYYKHYDKGEQFSYPQYFIKR